MGVGIHSAIHLCKLKQKISLGGDLLTLGVQDAVFTEETLRGLALQYGLQDPPGDWKAEINKREPHRSSGHITGASLWEYLRFSSVTTLDVSEYEGASVIVDLNAKNSPPDELEKKFDVIFDGGTIEHLFHLPNALENLFQMTKVGGVIIHQTPSLPLIDHGFYMFSPTFFHDFYSANGFEILDLQMVMYSLESREPCWFTDYTPGCFQWISNRGYCFPGMNFLVLGCFRRLEETTGNVVPQQGAYLKSWETAMKQKSVGG